MTKTSSAWQSPGGARARGPQAHPAPMSRNWSSSKWPWSGSRQSTPCPRPRSG